MRKAGSSMGWRLVLYALSALVVGCTSTPANTVIEPQTNISTSATETSHFYVAAKRPKNGEPRRFYLVKNGSSWILKFSPEDVSNPNTERFLYWPSDRLVTLDFEGKWIGDLEKSLNATAKIKREAAQRVTPYAAPVLRKRKTMFLPEFIRQYFL
jgi:hypothetical protein